MAPIATAIKHPLESKVDRIIQLNLGYQETWKVGQKILVSRFDHIRNRGFVNKRMQSLGFVLNDNLTCFHYVGVRAYRVESHQHVITPEKPRNRLMFQTPKRKNPRMDWVAKEVLKVSPRLRGLLRHLMLFEYVSTGHLGKASRKRVADMVTALRAQGYTVGMTREWSEKIGTNVTIYKLKTSNSSELLEAC